MSLHYPGIIHNGHRYCLSYNSIDPDTHAPITIEGTFRGSINPHNILLERITTDQWNHALSSLIPTVQDGVEGYLTSEGVFIPF